MNISRKIPKKLLLFPTLLIMAGCFLSKRDQYMSRSNPGRSNNDSLTVGHLIPVGRTRLVNQGLELITTAAHFSVQFSGEECKMKFILAKGVAIGYIQYELDHQYGGRIKISQERDGDIIFKTRAEGPHLLTIFKTTEASSGGIIVSRISGRDIKAFVASKKPLIEFIGNSITCGAMADTSTALCGSGQYADHHNAYMAYGPRVARMLDCEFIINSVSGIGCYRNWNTDGPAMPQVYERLTFSVKDSSIWNIHQFSPDIISIALGTNDLSAGDGKTPRLPFDNEKFVNSYISFVTRLKQIHPSAKIVLLNAPTKKGEQKAVLELCLARIKKSIDRMFPKALPVTLVYFNSIDQPGGCTGHPSINDHAAMAGEIASLFKKLLK